MGTIQKFLFEESFDDGRSPLRPEEMEPEPAGPAEPEPPPEPTFTLAELREQIAAAEQAARAQGFEEGRVKGRQEAETADQRALAEALRTVEADLKALVAAEQAARALRAENTVRMVLSIVRKLFPAYVRTHGQAEVEATVAHFLTELLDEPKLVIRVHESRLDALRDRIDDMAGRLGFAGNVGVLADPRLGPLDVRAEWGDGGAERDATAIWTDIERIAGDLLAGFPGGPAAERSAPAAILQDRS